MENTNYLGRICRFFGRITLFVGFAISIGTGTLLAINPFVSANITRTAARTPSTQNNLAPRGVYSFLSQNQILGWLVAAVIITTTLIAFYYLCQRYNNSIRNIIINISKHTKMPIHMIELGLPLIVWSVAILMLIFSFPPAATVFIFTFIFNELFFLFGWISYGMPDYKV